AGRGGPAPAALAAAALRGGCPVRVLRSPAPRTFGAAVRAALADHEAYRAEQARRRELPPPAPEPWLWLLHDDSAPDRRAHAELLRAGDSGPSIAVAGPKQRAWARPDILLEAGAPPTPPGRRLPDIPDRAPARGPPDAL